MTSGDIHKHLSLTLAHVIPTFLYIKQINTQMFIESKSIDLYDQNMDMACAKVNSDVHAYYWN